MSNVYVNLDSKLINKPEVTRNQGVETFSSLPPFFVPQQLRFSAGSLKNELSVDLIYNSEVSERKTEEELDSGVKLYIGKSSNRIYKVIIPFHVLNDVAVAKSSSHDLKEKVSQLFKSKKTCRKHKTDNSYQITKSVFENYANNLFNFSRVEYAL